MRTLTSPEANPASRRLARQMRKFSRSLPYTSESCHRMSCLFSVARPHELMDAITLAEEAEGPHLVFVLLMLTSSPDPFVRMSACDALGRLGVEEAVPRLRKFLCHYNLYQRAGAAEGLAAMRVRDAIPEIEPLLGDPSPIVRSCAMGALAVLRAHDAAPRIAEFLASPEFSLRLAAAHALAVLGAVEWASRIVPLLFEKDELTQSAALSALRNLRARAGEARIVELIEGGLPSVVGPAILAAGRIGIQEAVPAIRRRLDDPDWQIHERAALALAELGDDAGVPLLLEDRDHIEYLNALHCPATWKKLDSILLNATARGTPPELLARIGKETGLRIEVEKAVARRLDLYDIFFGVPGRSRSLLELLRAALPGGVGYILEPEAIRILPRKTVKEWWSQWWERRLAAAKGRERDNDPRSRKRGESPAAAHLGPGTQFA